MPFADSPDPVEAILEGLTERQREAVTHPEGPLLVVAGAGSGKTRVITCRIAWLIAARGVDPRGIAAITFTNKAAEEMRRRVQELVPGGGVHVSTFHSMCGMLLRRYIDRIGMDATFTIYDRADSMRTVRRVLREMERDNVTFKPGELMEYISSCKNRVLDPEQALANARFDRVRQQAEGYRRYQAHLKNSNALDFDDLLGKVLELFNRAPEVLQDLQHRYEHVLVDEYQDTNLPQHVIAASLAKAHRNITVVGDPDQTIYTWRGARIGNLMDFEQEFPGTRVVMLERNYRSTANILNAANRVVARNTNRYPKKLYTEQGSGTAVEVHAFANSHEEAAWVAERIQKLIEAGENPAEIAVFYRTRNQAMPLERAMVETQTPYQVTDSTRLLDRACVKDLRAYLQLLVNPRDDIACLRAINMPPRGIGAKTVERLTEYASEQGLSLMEVCEQPDKVPDLGTRAVVAVEKFADLMRELETHADDSLVDLVGEIIERVSYLEAQKTDERLEVKDALDLWSGDLRAYEDMHPEGNLQGYLEQVALVSDADTLKDVPCVPLMTLHATKGLEFDNVFIVGVEQDILPHRRSLDDDAIAGEGESLEEERRLFYVGMTRARKGLFITHARFHVMGNGGGLPVVPSDFLDELPEQGVEHHTAGYGDPDDQGYRGPVSYGRSGRGHGAADAGQKRRRQIAMRRTMAGVDEDTAYRLKRKNISLSILDGAEGDRLAAGVKVTHPQFGDGVITSMSPMAGRFMLKVTFEDSGPMSLLLAAEDVVEAEE